MDETQWSVVPDIDDDGNIGASRLIRHLPGNALEELDVCLEITVALDDRASSKRLDEQAERLIGLHEPSDLLDVCRTLDLEEWRWLAYCRDSVAGEAAKRAEDLFRRWNPSIERRSDPGALAYQAVVPTDDERQVGADVQVLTHLASQGDRLLGERPIEHVLVFTDAAEADVARPKLIASGFDVADLESTTDSGSAALGVVATGVPSLPELRSTRRRLLDVSRPARPQYDGWGCDVVRDVPETKRRWFRR